MPNFTGPKGCHNGDVYQAFVYISVVWRFTLGSCCHSKGSNTGRSLVHQGLLGEEEEPYAQDATSVKEWPVKQESRKEIKTRQVHNHDKKKKWKKECYSTKSVDLFLKLQLLKFRHPRGAFLYIELSPLFQKVTLWIWLGVQFPFCLLKPDSTWPQHSLSFLIHQSCMNPLFSSSSLEVYWLRL